MLSLKIRSRMVTVEHLLKWIIMVASTRTINSLRTSKHLMLIVELMNMYQYYDIPLIMDREGQSRSTRPRPKQAPVSRTKPFYSLGPRFLDLTKRRKNPESS